MVRFHGQRSRSLAMKFDTVGSDEATDGPLKGTEIVPVMYRLLVPEAITSLSLFLKFVDSGRSKKEL